MDFIGGDDGLDVNSEVDRFLLSKAKEGMLPPLNNPFLPSEVQRAMSSNAVSLDASQGPDGWCGSRVDCPWAASRGWQAFQSNNPDAPRGALEMRVVGEDGQVRGDLYVPNVPEGYRRWERSGGNLVDPTPETTAAPDEWCGDRVQNDWAEKRGWTAFSPRNAGVSGAIEMRVTDPLGEVHGALYIPDEQGGYQKHPESGGDIELFDPLGANSPATSRPNVMHLETKPVDGVPKNHVANTTVDVDGSLYTLACNYTNGSIVILDPNGEKLEFPGDGFENSGFPERCAAPEVVIDGDKVHVFYTSFDGDQKEIGKAWGENAKQMKVATFDSQTGDLVHSDVEFQFADDRQRELIDAEVWKNPDNGRYYLFASEVTAPAAGWKSHLCWSSADSLDGPWSDPKPLQDSRGNPVDQRLVNATGQIEAPNVIEAPCIDPSSEGNPKLFWSIGPCTPAAHDPLGPGSAPMDPATFFPDSSAVRQGTMSFDADGTPQVQIDNSLIFTTDGVKSMATHPDVRPDGTLCFYAKFEEGDDSYYQAVTAD